MHEVKCPHCGAPLDNDESLTGQEVVCPACSGIFRVSPSSPPAGELSGPVAAAPGVSPTAPGPPADAEVASASIGAGNGPPADAAPATPPLGKPGPDPLSTVDAEIAPEADAEEADQDEAPRNPRVAIYSLLGLIVFLVALIVAVQGGRYIRDHRVADSDGEKTTLEQWIEQLSKGKSEVSRREAAEALVAQGPEALAAALDAATDAPEEGNIVSIDPPAAAAIVSLGPEVVEPLSEALRSETLDVRLAAAYLLREMGSGLKDAVPSLARAATDDNARVRWYAIDALANAGPDAAGAVDALIPLVDHEDRHTKSRAVVALGRIGPKAKAAVPALTNAHKKARERSIRQAASVALHLIDLEEIANESMSGASDEVKQLVEQLNGDDETRSATAARALGRLGHRAVEAAPVLALALARDEKWVREAAAEALGTMGLNARPFIPALQKAAKDEEPEVRKAAQRSLRKIRPR